jgi:hypothetical protein
VRGAPPSSAAEPDGGREMGRVFFFSRLRWAGYMRRKETDLGCSYRKSVGILDRLLSKECWIGNL